MRVDASGVDLVRVDFVEVDLVAPNLIYTYLSALHIYSFLRIRTVLLHCSDTCPVSVRFLQR